jgi:hypothetical protein
VAKSLEGSLARLDLDRVDIFHLHNAITETGGGEALSVRQVMDRIASMGTKPWRAVDEYKFLQTICEDGLERRCILSWQFPEPLTTRTKTGSTGLKLAMSGKARSEMSALQPYRGKPAVRNDRGGSRKRRHHRSPIRASILPDCRFSDAGIDPGINLTRVFEGIG